MIKLQPICYILIVLLLIKTQSSIPQNYTLTSNATLIPNVRDIGYSHNQRLLVVIEQNLQGGFYLYNGIRVSNQKKVQVKDQCKSSASPSAFAFNHDDSLLIIGTQQGSVFGYKIVNQTISDSWSYNISFGSRNETFTVRSISIDPKNNIVVAVKQNIYILTLPAQTLQDPHKLKDPKILSEETAEFVNKCKYPFVHLVQSVSWSVLEENVVIVGTMGQINGNFTLFYVDNKTEKSINYNKAQNIAISTDGKTIYKSSPDNEIEVYAYQAGDIPKLVKSISQSNSSTKISVSKDGKYFTAVVRGGRVKSWKVSEQTRTNQTMQIKQEQYQNLRVKQENLKMNFNLSLDQEGKNFALSDIANDILIIPNTGIPQVPHFTLCPTNTYLSTQQSDCLPCSPTCANCFTQQICISCQNDKFIDGDTCSECNTKLDGCLTCESSEKCLTCDQGNHWNQQAVDGKCQCQDTYYDKAGKCQECSVFLDCQSCQKEDYCTKCKNQGNFDTEPVDGKCQCKTSFWLNTTLCQQCSTSIKDCINCTQDGKQCHNCQSTNRRPSTNQSKCQCIDYYYQDDTGNCQFCDTYQTCLQCQPQDPHNCTKCDQSKNRKQTPKDGKCICNDGFYDNQKGECLECQKAIPDCFTCENSNNCLACKNESNFNPDPVGGKCVCVSGWILDDKVCKLCGDKIVGCKNCSSTTFCVTCNKDLHFVESPTPQGKCVCQPGYWFDGNLCQSCSSKVKGCETCSDDGSKCLTCQDPNRSPSQAGTSCDCKEYFYEDANQTCQLCDQKKSCLRCNQTDQSHKCLQCDSNKHYNATPSDGVCKCETGYNEYDGKCILCQVPGCVQCPTQKTCNKCDQAKQFKPYAENNICKCIPGTYKSQENPSCINCSLSILGCKQCDNAADCTLCDQSKHFVLNINTYKCDCNKSYYLKNNQSCEQCNSTIGNCVECLTMGTQVQCTACEKGYGTSTNRKSCVECAILSVGCVECNGGQNCTKCNSQKGFILKDNKCVCSQGLYLKDGTCLQCSSAIPGCNLCDSETSCKKCTNQSHFSPTPDANNKCVCISGWTLSDKQCKACNIIVGCLQCSDTKTCKKCDDLHFFEPTLNQTCQCKQSYWLNVSECAQCSKSIYDCKLCSQDGKNCSACLDPNRQVNKDNTACNCKNFTYQDSNKKCQFCDDYQNCIQCSPQGNHKCEICDVKKFWNQKPNADGICTCQTGFTQYNHSCIKCGITGCSQCQQPDNCFQCSQENRFTPQPVDNKCKCQPDTLIDTDKCYYCKEKLVGCMTCSNLTQCQKCASAQFFVLNNNTKQCECDSSHYLVVDVCKNCSQGIKYCQECLITNTTKKCTKCKNNFIPSQDNTSCLNCEELIIGCANCLDIKNCQQCDTQNHFVFNQDKTKCVCDKKYFLKDKDCVACSDVTPGCLECNFNGKECSQCEQANHFALDNQTQKCYCVDGYFLSNNSCLDCSTKLPGCLTCSSNASECLSCQPGYFLSQGICSLCSTMIPGCTMCSDDGAKCSECKSDNFILNQKTQKCDCIEKYFLNITQCSLCEAKFIGCSLCNVNECNQCKPQHFVYSNNTKQCLCEDNYYLNVTERSCKLCSQAINGCVKCGQNGQKCGQCNDTQQFILDNSTNKCLCKEGYFVQQNKCSLCSSLYPGCNNCSEPSHICSSCNSQNNFIFNPETKLCSCKQLYFISSATQCKLCSDSITYCQTCQSTPGNFTPQCEKCKDGFEMSPQKSCLCPSNDKEIVDGQCVNKNKINWLPFAIGGGVLLLIGVAVFVYMKWRRAKSRVSLQEEEFEQGKRTGQETLLTSENNSNFLKSQGSLDIDE